MRDSSGCREISSADRTTHWDSGTNTYACADTEDYIFLLSEQEVTNSAYGFNSSYINVDTARRKQNTDYAKSQGVWTSTSSGYEGNGFWWLRSPLYNDSYDARLVYYSGYADYDYYVRITFYGVVPALKLKLVSGENGGQSSEPTDPATPSYTSIDETGVVAKDGNYLLFGSYPQSEVTGEAITSALTAAAGSLPTESDGSDWTSYGYYINGSVSNYMWYIDLEYSGEKYRGVYFTQYRPYYTTNSSSAGNSHQDNNGYNTSTVYWFKYEPIKWRILSESNGEALILCESIIDSQEYYKSASNRTINGQTVYANNYAESNIRAWLNDTFYRAAFTDLQKQLIVLTTVDNSARSTSDSGNNFTQATSYYCADTEDYIFLLSEQEVTNSDYGFNSSYIIADTARQKKNTDYAKSQGVATSTSSGYEGNGYWWLRSPDYRDSDLARLVSSGGGADNRDVVYITGGGVVPALKIKLD